jgi:hypothetical protein
MWRNVSLADRFGGTASTRFSSAISDPYNLEVAQFELNAIAS